MRLNKLFVCRETFGKMSVDTFATDRTKILKHNLYENADETEHT